MALPQPPYEEFCALYASLAAHLGPINERNLALPDVRHTLSGHTLDEVMCTMHHHWNHVDSALRNEVLTSTFWRVPSQ